MKTVMRSFLILSILLFLISCGETKKDTDTVTLGIESSPKTLDPRYATDAGGMRISHNLIFSSLVQLGYNLEIVPDLAEKWEIKDDTTYLFYLKNNVYFHNGEKLTARDVKFTFEHLMDPETKSPFAGLYKDLLKEIRVIDDNTIEFILKKPAASFLTSVIMPVIPEKDVKSGSFEKKLIGTGPFKISKNSPTEIALEPFDKYFGGMPKYKKLLIKVIKEDNTRFLKMKKGEIDLVIDALPLNKINKFKEGDLKEKYNIIESPGITYQYLGFNVQNKAVSDKRIRKAIAYGLNIKEIIDYRLEGHAVPANSLFSSVNIFYEKNSKSYPYNPKKAKALLKEAGFDSTNPLKLELKTSNNDQVVGIARIIQAQLKEIGIDLKITSYEWGTFYSDIKKGNFQFTSLRWVGVTEPDFYYDLFHSSELPPKGRNRGRYVNKEIDRLVEQGRITLDQNKRKAIYSKVQKILAEDLPYISLWHTNNISIVSIRIKGYKPHPSGAYVSLKDIEPLKGL